MPARLGGGSARLAAVDLDVVRERRDEAHTGRARYRNARLERERHRRAVHLLEQVVGQPLEDRRAVAPALAFRSK
jgi:hypothetical protein